MKYSTALFTLIFFSLSLASSLQGNIPEPDESSLYGNDMSAYENFVYEGALKNGAPLEQYLLVHQRLQNLFVGLYGEAHPLQPYLDTIKQLTYEYAKARKRLINNRSFSREVAEETGELAETLNDIKQYSEELLGNFKVEAKTNENTQSSTTMPSIQEWQQLANAQQQSDQQAQLVPPPTIVVTPTTPTNQQDNAFKAFFGAMQNAQATHPQFMADHDIATKQVYVFVIGLVILAVSYIVISKKIAPELADLEITAGGIAAGYAVLTARINDLLKNGRLT